MKEDLVGKKIGDLTIINEDGQQVITALCACGETVTRTRNSIIASRSRGLRCACKACIRLRTKRWVYS